MFKGEVEFEKTPTFNKDTAGKAVILNGTNKVKVSFDKDYEITPIVYVNTITNQKDNESIDDETWEVRPLIVNISKSGFVIQLKANAEKDLEFSWVAIAVKDAKTFTSEPEEKEEENNYNNSNNSETIIDENTNTVIETSTEQEI